MVFSSTRINLFGGIDNWPVVEPIINTCLETFLILILFLARLGMFVSTVLRYIWTCQMYVIETRADIGASIMLKECEHCRGRGAIWHPNSRIWFSRLISHPRSEELYKKWAPLLKAARSVQEMIKISHNLERMAKDLNEMNCSVNNLSGLFKAIAKGENPTPIFKNFGD